MANMMQVLQNWLIGRRIVVQEQQGKPLADSADFTDFPFCAISVIREKNLHSLSQIAQISQIFLSAQSS